MPSSYPRVNQIWPASRQPSISSNEAPAYSPLPSPAESLAASRANSFALPSPAEPPEFPFLLREPYRRCTTITLREIRYPLGCPCHPSPAEHALSKKPNTAGSNTIYKTTSWDRPDIIWRPHARPELTGRSESQESNSSRDSSVSGQASTSGSSTSQFDNAQSSRPVRPRGLSRLFSRFGS